MFLFFGGFEGSLLLIFLLINLLLFILLIWAIVDLVRSEFKDSTNKIIWALVIIFVPLIGPVLYLVIGRKQKLDDRIQ